MDLRAFFTTFGLVFLAELGDKTQLTTMSMAASSGRRWLVFVASALALALSSLIAVLAGEWLRARVEPVLIDRVAGALFVVIGGWMLASTFMTKA
ncbi:TMEM165/GDT1 family protein [Nannocystis sp. SCPEA4]|uniref:TMEM165/GDT1 family protein n=1 Tax=Nannocystis sp. SCPEA4 TaxID=2996787 RepID=UPI00226DD0EC|nr:TMEM165/GDT1 family protein [Nannocystis sp. SCPEA4]MCY1063007.1 TMEM165/GDT1 family protein [Nannocystis sp. SCPEA4]